MPEWMGEELPSPATYEVSELAKEAMAATERCLNSFNSKHAYDLAYLLASNHRTLVQNAMRDLVVPFILWLAEAAEDNRYDQRNQGSVTLAAELARVIRSESISLPVV